MEEIHLDDIQVDRFWESLSKLVGQPIKDVLGYVSHDGSSAYFNASLIVLEDGTQLDLQGEHDAVYVTSIMPQHNLDDATLERLYEEKDEDRNPD